MSAAVLPAVSMREALSAAFTALWRFKVSVISVIAACAAVGLILWLTGTVS